MFAITHLRDVVCDIPALKERGFANCLSGSLHFYKALKKLRGRLNRIKCDYDLLEKLDINSLP